MTKKKLEQPEQKTQTIPMFRVNALLLGRRRASAEVYRRLTRKRILAALASDVTMTRERLAKKIGCAPQTMQKRLDQFGICIPTRKHGWKLSKAQKDQRRGREGAVRTRLDQSRCYGCDTWLPIDRFGWRYGRRSLKCKACHNKAATTRRNSRSASADELARRREYKRQWKRALGKKLFAYLSSHPCVDCGECDPVVLDFDHVRGVKLGAISALMNQGWNWDRLQTEVEKCDMRCANCHRRKTAKERNWKLRTGG